MNGNIPTVGVVVSPKQQRMRLSFHDETKLEVMKV
jgi:hypothetical protein